jgi:hypothetical protein
MAQIILEDMPYEKRIKYLEARGKKREEEQKNSNETMPDNYEEVRYRCEQTVVIKSNDMIVSHADTKREFVVKKGNKDNRIFIHVSMVDNIINIKPEGLSEAAQLLSDLDDVKCSDLLIIVENTTGMMDKILNHKEIISKWNKYKDTLYDKYSFIRAEPNRQKLYDFTNIAENMIKNQDLLLQDLKAKLFFDLFFDKYLVSTKNLFDPYSRTFSSQLFEGVRVVMNFNQEVLKESSDMFMVKKHSEIDKKKLDLNTIKAIYDKKFKPQIKYKFSEYDFKVIENAVFSTGGNYWIEQSDVSIMERVKNNIDVLVKYKLKKIES